MKFKLVYIVFLLLISINACKQKENSNEGNLTTLQDSTSNYNNGDTIQLSSLQNNNRASLAEIIPFVGKKPSEVDLFSKMGLRDRIKAIMKDQYAAFESSWQDDTPLQAKGEIVYTSACKSGDCMGAEYIIIFDTKVNAINIYQLNSNKMRSYEEDNLILGLPYDVQDWLDVFVEKHMKVN
jgi:hypothetical protein